MPGTIFASAFGFVLLNVLAVFPLRAAETAAPMTVAVLQGLDKTTARVSTIEAPIGGVARFGTLAIAARACHKKPPTETPESAAFLEIVDVRPDSPAVQVFQGWMFASSPAVSAMEHPVYDIWVIDCKAAPTQSADQTPDRAEENQEGAPASGAGVSDTPDTPDTTVR